MTTTLDRDITPTKERTFRTEKYTNNNIIPHLNMYSIE